MQSLNEAQDFLTQGYSWFAAEFSSLKETCISHLQELGSSYYTTLSREKLERLSQQYLTELKKGLEQDSSSSQDLMASFQAYFEQGAQMKTLLEGLDLMLTLVAHRARQAMSNEPELYDTLMLKIRHTDVLIRSQMATAFINFINRQNRS
ncbi:MAG TPA: hypothetical protein VH186_25585 [Chloroflexia bacterium]|nr:hypothetical protein [Chloroflexia bacterium]